MPRGKDYLPNGRGKSNAFSPYAKSVSLNRFATRMEDYERFLKTEAGREWSELKAMRGQDINQLTLDDYSPPCSPARVLSAPNSYREATAAEIEHWQCAHPDQFERHQTGLRIRMGNALMKVLPKSVAWAKAFKRFPKSENNSDYKSAAFVPSFVIPEMCKKHLETITESPTEQYLEHACGQILE